MEFLKSGRSLCNCFFNVGLKSLLSSSKSSLIQTRTYAARKGYRELAKKKKVKAVIQKKVWTPKNVKGKKSESQVTKQLIEHTKQTPVDNVYFMRFYTWKLYDFREAVECHRETHHPTIYNLPNAQINLFVELDLKTAKPTKFVENFKRMAILPNVFEQDDLAERSILVFCKTEEQKESAMTAGANLVGGPEIIRDIEKGKVVLPDFKFIIAHPSILPEMVTIRGLLKRRFPSVHLGTLGPNVGELVAKFKNGIEYSCVRHEKELSFGWINTAVGRLSMDDQKLEENFQALVDDINKNRPKRPGPFITRVIMSSPPSKERFKINFQPFSPEQDLDEGSSSEDEAVTAKA